MYSKHLFYFFVLLWYVYACINKNDRDKKNSTLPTPKNQDPVLDGADSSTPRKTKLHHQKTQIKTNKRREFQAEETGKEQTEGQERR
jgi:hypothetical protein